jgi:hypothetical protein
MTTSSDPMTTVDPRAVALLPRAELDERFRKSPPGPIPVGRSRGTAILFPGSAVEGFVSGLVRALIWKGKIFSPASGDLKNLISPFGIPLIRAKVYQDESWFSKGPAIILDYSKTSVVAGKIRDEIRQIGPGVYLGQVYWGKRRIALFMLEFPVGKP